MPAILEIDGFDLYPYLRVAPGEGFDPADADFQDPQFGEVSLGDGQPLMAVNDNNREMVWPVHLHSHDIPRVNLAVNPKLADDDNGVSAAGGGTTTRETSPAGAPFPFSTKTVGSGSGQRHIRSVPVTNATQYTASCWAYIEGASGGISIVAVAADGSSVKASSSNITTVGSWVRVSVTFTADATATWTIGMRQSGATASTFYTTGWLIEEGAAVRDYFDGSSAGCKFDGTPNGSSSSRYVGKDGLHALVTDIKKRLDRAQRVEWRDDGATNSTFYDVVFARFEADYNFRRGQRNWLSGVLRVWTKPMGSTGTLRVVGTAATQTLGRPVFVSLASVIGDQPAKMTASVGARVTPVTVIATQPVIHGLSLLPTTSIGFVQAASFVPGLVAGGDVAATMMGATGAIASQARRSYFFSNYDAYDLAGFQNIGGTHVHVPPGRHRVLGMVRSFATTSVATGAAVYAKDVNGQTGPTTVLRPSQSWTLVDFGTFSAATMNYAQGVSIVGGFMGSVTLPTSMLDCCGMYFLPERESVLITDHRPHRLVYSDENISWLATNGVQSPEPFFVGQVPRISVATMQKLMAFGVAQKNPNNAQAYGTVSVAAEERFTYAR